MGAAITQHKEVFCLRSMTCISCNQFINLICNTRIFGFSTLKFINNYVVSTSVQCRQKTSLCWVTKPVTVLRLAAGSVSLQPLDKNMSLQPNVVGHKNMSITIALRVMVMLLLFSSCSGRKKEMGAAITERDSLPVMDTKGVTTLISDSGITRYRVNTAEWLIYDRKKPPYCSFDSKPMA